MSEINDRPTPNIRSDGYLIAKSTRRCAHCLQMTPVVALGVPAPHETLPDEDDGVPEWERVSWPALLFYVESIPDAVRRRLQRIAPGFRQAFSPVMQATYWANHCDSCEGLQEDHDMFCEPDGAFLPTDPQAAAALEWVSIHEPLQATAAGYAPDPEFREPPAAG